MPDVKKRASRKRKSVTTVAKAQSEPGVDYIDNLPDEMLCEILSFLSPVELSSCAIVSKRWRGVSNQHLNWKQWCVNRKWIMTGKNPDYKACYRRRMVSDKFCLECGQKTVCKFPLIDNITLCSRCRKSIPKYETLSKTRSKTEFMLTDADLETLEFWEVGFFIGGTRRCKYLYLRSELERVSQEKWGNEFDEEKNRRLERLARFRARRAAAEAEANGVPHLDSDSDDSPQDDDMPPAPPVEVVGKKRRIS